MMGVFNIRGWGGGGGLIRGEALAKQQGTHPCTPATLPAMELQVALAAGPYKGPCT